jgi:hypothetical protein
VEVSGQLYAPAALGNKMQKKTYRPMLWNFVVAICTTSFNIKKLCTMLTYSIYVFRVVLARKSNYFPEQHGLVSVMKVLHVLCDGRTEFINII